MQASMANKRALGSAFFQGCCHSSAPGSLQDLILVQDLPCKACPLPLTRASTFQRILQNLPPGFALELDESFNVLHFPTLFHNGLQPVPIVETKVDHHGPAAFFGIRHA